MFSPGETANTWKASLMVRTLQAGSLCYIAFRTGTRGMEMLLQALPRTRRDLATA
jgi:hypothetical protein